MYVRMCVCVCIYSAHLLDVLNCLLLILLIKPNCL